MRLWQNVAGSRCWQLSDFKMALVWDPHCSSETTVKVLVNVLLALESGRTCFKTGLCYLLLSLVFFTCKMVLLETTQGYCDGKMNE